MNIGIDIDGVLTNMEEFLTKTAGKYALEHNLDFDYEMSENTKCGFLNMEDNNNFWEEYWFEYARTIPIRPFASQVIAKLKEDGNNIFIITARSYDTPIIKYGVENRKRMEQIIVEWLKKNNVVYDKIIFSNIDKLNDCLENKIDVMIEDTVSNIKQLKEYMRVICFDAKYNRFYNDSEIKRVNNWNDVYKIIVEKS